MTLVELLARISKLSNTYYDIVQGANTGFYQDILIEDVSFDSRYINERTVFGAFSTNLENAIQYIEQAIFNNAKVIVISPEVMRCVESNTYFNDIVWLVCDQPRQLFAKITSKIYEAAPQHLVAITGTAGKTSVCSLILQLWTKLQVPAASIGTLGLNHNLKGTTIEYTSTLTTPDAITLHRCLAQLKQHNIDHVVMEASSHGLDQNRLDGLRFTTAAFTSFSHDHLDYHSTMPQYFAAKRRLFEDLLSSNGCAVLNADIPEYQELETVCNMRNIPFYSYGRHGNFLRLKSMEINTNGQQITLEIDKSEYKVQFPLIGSTQAYNLMCAMTVVLKNGANLEKLIKAAEEIHPIPGRLNFAGKQPNGAMIYVDYAHKPEALELVLKDMRHYFKGKLHVVFGCGGDRDKEKRLIMGQIARNYADKVTITDDNPRTENPDEIRKQILMGCLNATEIPSRKQAIEQAIQNLEPHDVLIIAGKGHEKYQIIGTDTIPFDDMEVVQQYLNSYASRNASTC